MNYVEAMNFILSLTDYERDPGQALAPANYNLDRVLRLMDEFDNPQNKFKSIHLAGTKGKGSTAATIASVLTAAGYKTGLFTSPHLHVFEERIRIDGNLIAPERLAAIVEMMVPHVANVHERFPELGRLTTFEITAALGFIYFAEQNVDFGVIEVGLGGRLDATNILNPLVAVLTPISLDHTQVLGDTIAAIAKEKAGIIKENGIVVVAPQPQEALEVFRQEAAVKHARLFEVDANSQWREDLNDRGEGGALTVHGMFGNYVGLGLRLLGQHQVMNTATAIAALECLRFHNVIISPQQIRDGIALVKWPGRLEMIHWTPRVLVDGAHNNDSMARLREALQECFQFRRLILVIGTSAGHDIAGMAREIAPVVDHAIATRSKHPRSVPPAEVAEQLRKCGIEVTEAPDLLAALRRATEMAGSEDLVVATGSLFTVAEAREAFGLTQV